MTSLASSTTTAATIRSKTLSAGTGYSAKSSSQDIVVTLGGLKWSVVYLSNDTDGNPVLTLWLSNSTQDAFNSRSKTEGQYYGFYNGGLYSDWSGDWSSTTVGSYPSNMYGTSYIRVVTLNNGGNYAVSTGSSTGTINKSASSVFAPFTMDQYGMTEYIVKPTKMSWQRDQSSITELNSFTSYTLPNEAIAPTTTNWNRNYDYSGKTDYTAWGNDCLWLPSIAETGYSDSGLGMWEISENQRRNYDGSTQLIALSGAVGSSNKKNNSEVYNYPWLRSSHWSNSYQVYSLAFSSTHKNIVSASHAVRPALHLNLKKVNEDLVYLLDLNGKLDGEYKGDTISYGTCDIYINGVKVASDATDYWTKHPYGSKYEIKNIKAKPGKRYVGVADGALSGTITAQTVVYLEFRTETWEDYAAASYASGSGTEASPYIIKTPEQLGKLAKDSRSSNLSGKYYKLGSNIDLSAHIWQGIGTGDYRFGGNFDGDFYTIRNIKTSIDYFILDNIGLFSYIQSGRVENVIMKNGEVKGRGNVGGIAGFANGTIYKCVVNGVNVIGVSDANGCNIGGIAGAVHWLLSSCVYENGRVQGGYYTAGICGYSVSSRIECSVINATIIGSTSGTRAAIVTPSGNGITTSSYGYGTVNGTATKQMYGDSSAWGNWSYSPLLNGGYPVQKTLFAIGGLTGSQNVYNYLTGTLKFSVA